MVKKFKFLLLITVVFILSACSGDGIAKNTACWQCNNGEFLCKTYKTRSRDKFTGYVIQEAEGFCQKKCSIITGECGIYEILLGDKNLKNIYNDIKSPPA